MFKMDEATKARIRAEVAARDAKRKADLERLGITQEMIDQTRKEMERDRIYELFLAYRELLEVSKERYCYLAIKTEDGGGIIDGGRHWWLDWDTAEEGQEKIKAEIARIKKENEE